MKREPIILSDHAVAVINIFTRTNSLEDLWILDVPEWEEEYVKNLRDNHERAAKQFVEQLEGYWTPAFMKALKNEIESRLKD